MAFILAMWLFGWWVSPTWAVAIGLLFVAARILYTAEYVADPRSRVLGAGLSFATILMLIVGGIVGCIRIGLTN